MARIINNQTNMWGRQQGPEPQRSDLWVADFTEPLKGLATVISASTALTAGVAKPYIPKNLFTYFCYNVTLPELKVRSEVVRRDTRPYQMPSWDEPVDTVKIQFILDCFKPGSTGQSPYTSDIYQMLDVWRAVVRAGRTGMSNEYSITLDSNFRIDYTYNVRVNLLRGTSPSLMDLTAASTATKFLPGVFGQVARASVSGNLAAGFAIQNDLEYSMQYTLVNCWLGSFKISELNYESAKLTLLDAIFYTEDILQPTSAAA